MRSRWLGLILAGMSTSAAHATGCKLSLVGTLPTVPDERLALIPGEVNGHPTRFLADTGADVTIMWRDQAQKLGVALGNTVNMEIYGVGGRAPVQVATIDDLKIGSAKVRNFSAYVVGSTDFDHDVSMALGNQFFVQSDVDFDLAENKILLLREAGCAGPDLVFWNKPYSQAPYRGGDAGDGAIYVKVLLNGQPVDAEIDSGATSTVIDQNLAARLGAVRTEAGDGASGHGVGFKALSHYEVRFQTFTLGDETIRNAVLQAAPLFNNVTVDETGTRLGSQSIHDEHPRMLLGADFLRAHQLLISRPHQMLYFSYLGGRVFDTATPSNRSAEAATPHEGLDASNTGP